MDPFKDTLQFPSLGAALEYAGSLEMCTLVVDWGTSGAYTLHASVEDAYHTIHDVFWMLEGTVYVRRGTLEKPDWYLARIKPPEPMKIRYTIHLNQRAKP